MAGEHDAFRARLRRKLNAAPLPPRPVERSAEDGDQRAAEVPHRKEAAAALERLLARRNQRAPRVHPRSPNRAAEVADVLRSAPRSLPAELRTQTNERGTFGLAERALRSAAIGAALAALRAEGMHRLIVHAQQPGFPAIELERLAFIDTETTALHGGAGCTVFMIGLGFLAADELRVQQIFLRAPADEAAALEHFLQQLQGIDALVSFHGKSFDRHRLQARLAMLGMQTPLLTFPHLDLYHMARRFYHGRLVNQRLQTIEREILGLQREDDLPGSQCPGAWFAHVAGRPSRIGDVFEHNLLDVVSLLLLAAKINAPLGPDSHEKEWLSYAKGSRLLGFKQEARAALDAIRAKVDPASVDALQLEDEQRKLDRRADRGS